MPSTPITYTVAIDADDDGIFAPEEAITADVLALEWRLGMDGAFESICGDSIAWITLDNTDGRYSPERFALLPGTRVRISAADGSDHSLFTGAIQRIEPAAGTLGKRTARLILRGLEAELAIHPVALPPMTDVRADEVINAVLEACALRLYPAADGLFIDVDGRNLINTHHPFGGMQAAWNLDAGRSLFAYVGHPRTGISAMDAIREAVISERGRFFIDGEGVARFLHRHRTMTQNPRRATFTNSADALTYAYGAEIINRVQVTVTPREIGADNAVLWSLTQAQTIAPDSSRRLLATFRDSLNRPQNALSVNPTLPYSSTNDSQLEVLLVAWGASSAEITVRNRGASTVTLNSLQILGVPLIEANPVTLDLRDLVSAALYGVHTLKLDLPALDSVEEAENIARYELLRRHAPTGRLAEITLSTPHHAAHILSRTLFERVRVEDSQTGHAADYLIVAAHHRVDQGGARHRAVWTLEPAESDIYIVIDLASIDGDLVIVPY